MDKISRLIEQLRSPDPGERYEACEQLRLAGAFPRAALDALRKAAHDPDPAVAASATDAIAPYADTNSALLPQLFEYWKAYWSNRWGRPLSLIVVVPFLWLRGPAYLDGQPLPWQFFPVGLLHFFLPNLHLQDASLSLLIWPLYFGLVLAFIAVSDHRIASAAFLVLYCLLVLNALGWMQLWMH